MTSKGTLSLLQKLWKARVLGGSFDHHLSGLQFVEGDIGKCKATLKVEPEHGNVAGFIHGGLTATLVDAVSTLALMTTEQGKSGSSVNLSVSFLRPAKVGSSLRIEAETIQLGKNLAFLEVRITDETSGKIVATGKHTKFIG